MSAKSFRAGVAGVKIPDSSYTTALPSFSALTFSASSVTPSIYDNADKRLNLDSSLDYQVILTPMGLDLTNSGYTMGQGSVNSGTLNIGSAGDGIKVSVTNANLSALGGGAAGLFAIGVWLKIGAANFQLVDVGYCDPSEDFVHVVMTKPSREALTKTSTLLQNTTADDDLGDRAPVGVNFRTLSPLTGTVTVDRAVDAVEFRPNTSANFSGATTRTAAIRFQLLSNDVRDVVGGNAGTFVRYTHSGTTYEEAQMSIQTASVKITGNKPMVLLMPVDKQGYQEVRLYLGQLLENQEANTEDWAKDDQTPISYAYQPVPSDTLLDGIPTEVIWKKKG